jgi:hypothetical protein
MTLENFIRLLTLDTPFAFSRFGDGEWLNIRKVEGRNCDGNEYYPDLGDRLKRIVSSKQDYILGAQDYKKFNLLSDVELYPVNDWVDADVFHKASMDGELEPFFECLSKVHVVYIGNSFLQTLPFIDEFIPIPLRNVWLEYDNVLSQIKNTFENKHKVYLFSAGMSANVFVDDLWKLNPSNTYIDVGSVFDPCVGRNTRGYHKNLNTQPSVTVKELGEFTWDLVRGLPQVNYLQNNKLNFTVKCKSGLKDIYAPFTSKITELGVFDEDVDNTTYSHSRPGFTLTKWSPPNLKSIYSSDLVLSSKPLVVIQNKHTSEWGSGPFNYFDIGTLDKILNLLYKDYTVVYFRPDGNGRGYFTDNNKLLEFNDYQYIKENYPEVIFFRDLLDQFKDYSYNTLQFIVSAKCEKFITVSGGNACVSSYFGKEVIIFDSPLGPGSGRGIWKTDSWLSLLNGAKIYGVNSYEHLITKVQELWTS